MLKSLQELLPVLEKICEKDLFIITSVGKSGSTWVQKILDCHPEVYCAGEGKFDTLISHSFRAFEKFNAKLDHTNQTIYANDKYYTTWGNYQRLLTTHFFMALAFLTAEKPIPESVRYIGDKDTSYIYNIGVWRKMILPDVKLIHVIRDVRDAIVSNVFHLNRQGADISIGEAKYYKQVESFARIWKKAICDTRRECEASPDLYMEVFYEHLLDDPFANTQKLLGFLGVESTEKTIKSCFENASFEKLTGGRHRGVEDKNSFLRKGIAGDWKNHFDKKAKDIVYQEAEDILVQLGYHVE